MKVLKINNYFYQDNNLQGVRDKVLRLSSRADDIREQVENEECTKRKKRKREVEEWLRNVHRKVGEVHDLEEQLKASSFITSMSIRSQLEDLEEDVERLIKQSEFPHGLVLDDLEPEGIQLVPMKLEGVTPSAVLEEICSCLMVAGHVRIGVYGMGGVGKTTLAMHIHNRMLKSSKELGHVFWVTVSRDTSSVYTLQSEIIKALRLDHRLQSVTDERKRAAQLSEFFRSLGKGFMLILDDVWEHIPLEKIGVPVEGRKCKLLITTRKLDVCRRMKCRPFKVEPLPSNEAWDLFVSQLGNFEVLSEEVRDVVRSVADECAGLPLGIVTMAGCMRGVDNVHEWRNVLRELQSSSLSQNEMENEVFSILKLSYARLNSDKLQRCFLFCAMYPEDHEIGRDELISYFIAEGLVDGRKRREQIDEGHALLNRLENSCLLEPLTSSGSHRRCVKMHDLVRDMAINITRENSRGMVMARKELKEVPSEHEWDSNLVRVSLGWNGIARIADDTSPRCSNLSTLLLLCNPLKTIPNSFFVHMTGLKVLDLSNTLIEELPDSVSDLYNLNALSLDSCENLHFIPSLAKLTNLRELDLCDTEITHLPEGMEALESLKHLDIRYTDMSKSFPARLLQGLPNLQSLLTTDIAISAKELAGLNHLESLEGLVASLRDFNEYVTSGCISQLSYYYLNVESVTEYEDLPFSRSIAIGNCGSRLGTPQAILMLPCDVQNLCLESSSFGASSLLEASPSLNHVRDLKRCKLSDCDGIKYILSSGWLERGGGDSVLQPLQGLEELYLKKLDGFCGLIEEQAVPLHGHGIFSRLRKLEVERCPRLRRLFSLDSLNHPLPFLEEIQILQCEGIEEVYASAEQQGSETSTSTDCDEASIVPKLEALRLSNVPKLRKLVVSDCPRIKKLLSLDVLNHHLPSLVEVHVSHCAQIEEILATVEQDREEILLPVLRVLKLLNLPELKSVCMRTMVCTSLRELKVIGCDKLMRFPISIPRLLEPHCQLSTTPSVPLTPASSSGADQNID